MIYYSCVGLLCVLVLGNVGHDIGAKVVPLVILMLLLPAAYGEYLRVRGRGGVGRRIDD